MRRVIVAIVAAATLASCATSRTFQEMVAEAPSPDSMSCAELAEELAQWTDFVERQTAIANQNKDQGTGMAELIALPFVVPIFVLLEPVAWLAGDSAIMRLLAGDGMTIQNENDARAAQTRIDAIAEAANRRGCSVQ